LKHGANVFDSAISALFCLSLTQIQSMGILGGFLLTAYVKSERKAFTVDAQMTSPRNFHMRMVSNFTDIKHGHLSIAVPGFLKGLWELHQKHGSVSWRKLIEPSLDLLCNEGITVTKHLHDSMHLNKRIMNDPYLREILMDSEAQNFMRPGSKIFLRKHCKFLETLANHTESDIYAGSVGEMITKDFKHAGSIVTRKDLLNYKIKWSNAIEFPMTDDDTILLPNTAAVLVPSILNIVKQYGMNASSFDSDINMNETVLTHHRIVEAFKHVFAVRSTLGDPDFVDVKKTVERLLSPEYAQSVKKLIDDSKTFDDIDKYSVKFIAPDDDGTSHISIIAADGDAISVTNSINY
jgi:gamma-glutamyltranspeptidase/glutathione hydrolase/leukotriene-C4 hydrolase